MEEIVLDDGATTREVATTVDRARIVPLARSGGGWWWVRGCEGRRVGGGGCVGVRVGEWVVVGAWV
jgi:hypothetical protein